MRLIWGTALAVTAGGFATLFCSHHLRSAAHFLRPSEPSAVRDTADTMKLAKRGFGTFLQKLRSPGKGQEYFSVAVPGAVVGARQARVWVDGLAVDGETMEGRVVSRTSGQLHPACGKVVRFPADCVCDWMIVENGAVEGAYTLR